MPPRLPPFPGEAIDLRKRLYTHVKPLRVGILMVAVFIAGSADAAEKSWFAALKVESTFVQSDLAGTWAVHQITIAGDAVTWEFGGLEIGDGGTITEGSTTSSTGRTRVFRSGRLSLNPTGQISGNFTVAEGSLDLEFLLQEGQLQAKTGSPLRNDTAVLTAACSACTPNKAAMVLLTRRRGNVSTADLNGEWRIYNLRFENATNELTWEFGPIHLLEDGELDPDDVKENFLQEPFGNQRRITAASLSVDSEDGTVSGWLESGTLDTIDRFVDGVLSPDKNRIVAVLEGEESEALLAVWVKTSTAGTFSTAQDLVGSWRLFGAGFESPPGDVWAGYGDLEIAIPPGTGANAQVTAGNLTAVGTTAVRLVGDELALNAVGRLAGTIASLEDEIIIASDPDVSVREDGRMDLQKASLTFVADGFIAGESRDSDEPDDALEESCFLAVAGRHRIPAGWLGRLKSKIRALRSEQHPSHIAEYGVGADEPKR